MSDLSLINGWVPIVLLVLGGIALFVLFARGGRASVITIAIAAVLALLTYFLLNWLVLTVFDVLPEPLPGDVRLWIAVGVGVFVLGVGSMVASSVGRKVTAIVCTVVALVTVGSQINVYFEEYPTVGTLVSSDEPSVFAGSNGLRSASETTPVTTRWKGTPGKSRVESAPIPGTVSGFTGRPAWIYLPPAYSGPNPPLLPVLILVSGQPGGPQDWIVSGRLQELLDGFATAHDGLAPVTVVVDPNGADDANSMCMDSDIAKADTYLTVDVVNWITKNVGVDSNHAHWTFGGWSFGGTCSIQMATRHPDLFPSFIDLAGEREPAISADRTQTVQLAFHGDTAAFDALTPLTLLSQKTYPNSWGFFAAGGDEPTTQQWMTEVSTAAKNAGMTVTTQIVPGQGHSWGVPTATLVPALDFLSPRMGFTR
ncbi:alpha/beta hydrolase-fold protein [Pseudonocardia sp. N23]|uniref:alpha/beta hydrolase-fold protein n=1 Tax=Pseudonocardia sp. N23 TaxID=1987376 RepID=UPI000BFDCCA6|nr:alpha/beta hydrolase-fold protein [Pseudonocardia sp. N23]